MFSVIVGTNRKGNVSQKVADIVVNLLNNRNLDNNLLELESLPNDFVVNNFFTGKESEKMKWINEHYIRRAEKFIFILPEYNGSFPGVLKAYIDAVPPEMLRGKKALLIGISAGRGGNIRGLDQFTNVLNYLKVSVYPFKLAVPGVEAELESEPSSKLQEKINTLIEEFENF